MKRSILLATLCAAAVSVQAAEKFTIDSSHTYPHFKINHLGFSTLHGRFNQTEGTLTLDRANNTGSVDVVIDAASIDTGFKKRDDHLRSPDFLNAAEFPEITYKSTNVKLNSDNSAVVNGELTLMGVTKPVTLSVASINCGDHPMQKGKYVCGFDANAKIKRSDFGVNYALPAVGDEMMLEFEVEAVRN